MKERNGKMTEANIKKVLDRFEEVFEGNTYGKGFYKNLSDAYSHAEKGEKGKMASQIIKNIFRKSKHQILKELWNGKILALLVVSLLFLSCGDADIERPQEYYSDRNSCNAICDVFKADGACKGANGYCFECKDGKIFDAHILTCVAKAMPE